MASRKQFHAHFHIQMIKALVLLAFLLVVGWAEEPPSGDYTFQLSHVDAHRDFSSDELMHRAASRSRFRAATMYSTTSSSPDITLKGRLCRSIAEYYVKFYVDTTPTFAVMDTGSNLLWVNPRDPADKCRNKKPLPCSDNLCNHHANCFCDPKEKKCQYEVTYGGSNGMTVRGLMYKDKLKLPLSSEGLETLELAFGCSTTDDKFKGCSAEIRGVVGMGRGAQSLPEQLKYKSFSYCLNKYSNPDLKSKLLFRKVPDLTKGKTDGAAVVTVPLGRHSQKSWYFVHLEDISIDGTRLGIPAFNPLKDHQDTAGNMFIDSGASYTLLEKDAFDMVVERVDKIMSENGYVKVPPENNQDEGDTGRDTGKICYSGGTNTGLPGMTLHFKGGKNMELPWESYLWRATTETCLAIEKLEQERGMPRVLGNYQQQGIHMHFDTEKNELKFVQADCSRVG